MFLAAGLSCTNSSIENVVAADVDRLRASCWLPTLRDEPAIDLSSAHIEDAGPVVSSARYGDICLASGSFKKIIAYDVLEHVKDLRELMTNCLELLEMGGMFEILVPYDLSFGAWQDPTHVRAFNEKSWL